mgnify:CR=1 FL=1
MEEELWEGINTEVSLFSFIGREGCISLDFSFNIRGSEGIAKTFISVTKSQRKDNQDPETTDMRTLLKFFLTNSSSCQNLVKEIA